MNEPISLTELSEAEWAVLTPVLPPLSRHGRPRAPGWRVMLEAIFDGARRGCAWRLLPHDVPPWQTGYHDVRQGRLTGIWAQGPTAWRDRRRVQCGRDPQPSAGRVDSQSGQTTRGGGPRGDAGGKQGKGRTRHLGVETQSFVLHAVGHRAGIMDRDGMQRCLEPGQGHFPRRPHLWRDAASNGQGTGPHGVETTRGGTAAIVAHPPRRRRVLVAEAVEVHGEVALPPPGFHVLPWRGIVEPTCGWIDQTRRLRQDAERLCATRETWIDRVMTRLMVRRLTRP